MKSRILWAAVCLLAPLGAMEPPCRAEPILEDTLKLLDHIITGFEANRARIHDIKMSGKFSFGIETHDGFKTSDGGFQFYQLGEKLRTDESESMYVALNPRMKGQAYRLAFNNGRTLDYEVGTKFASLGPSTKFFSSTYSYMDTLRHSNSWKNNVDSLRFLLQRGWDPQKESIRVESRQEDGRSLLVVHYESTRGVTLYTDTWVFDPQRGYEVIRDTTTGMEAGKVAGTIEPRLWEATYDVREVSPGVWRSVGTNLRVTDPNNPQQPQKMEVRITCDSVAANTGTVEESLFTFEGMGVPKGALVQDDSFDPPLRYVLAEPSINEAALEASVLAAAASDDNYASTASQPSPTTAPVQTQPAAGKLTESNSMGRSWKTWVSLGLLFLLSVPIGVKITRRIRGTGKAAELKTPNTTERAQS